MDRMYIRFQKLPTTTDKIVVKFTGKFNSFEVIVKENETTEIVFPRNFAKETFEEISRRVNTVIDSTRSTEPSENIRPSSHSPHERVRTTPTLNTQLTQSTLQDFDFIKQNDPFCKECSTKIDGLKCIMRELIEMDKVALPVCAEYTDYVINKMGLERRDITYDFGSKDFVLRALTTSCSTLRLLLDSCYQIAPYHSQGFEKLFKVITYFFELMVRGHEYSNKNLIRQLEQ
jgi:hypothetical protein